MSPPRTVVDYATPCPHSIGRAASLADAQRLMRAKRVHHLPVVEGKTKLVGVVSYRDVLLFETIRGVDPEEVPVDEAMTPLPYVVRPDAPLEEVVRQLLKKRIGSALVVEKEKVVGVFTTTDALQVLLELLEKAPKARSPRRSAKGS